MKQAQGEPEDGETGLPGLKTWRSVYLAVALAFCLWVSILLALPSLFA